MYLHLFLENNGVLKDSLYRSMTYETLYRLMEINETSMEQIREKFKTYRNDDGKTLLHIACCDVNDTMLKFALRVGVDINALDNKGMDCLHEVLYPIPILYKYDPSTLISRERIQMIKSLLVSGASYKNREIFKECLSCLCKKQKSEILNCIQSLELR